MSKSSIKNYKNRTLSNYKHIINRLEKKGIDMNNLQPIDTIISLLNTPKELSYSSQKTYLSAVLWNINEKNLDPSGVLILEIKDKIKKLFYKITKLSDESVFSESQLKNYICWDDILKLHTNMKSKFLNSYDESLDYILLSLYVFHPPRRLDYSHMLICFNNNIKDLPIDFNYYNFTTGEFIFNTYKSNKKYKTQTFKVIKDLNVIIKQFIIKYDVFGSLLNLSSSQIISRFYKIFSKFNKKVSVDIIRHSFIIYMWNNGYFFKNKGQQKKISFMMSHSLNMQHDYYKNVPFLKINKYRNFINKLVKTWDNNLEYDTIYPFFPS